MALLSYVAQQGIAIWEKQARLKLMPVKVDPTIESDTRSTSSKVKPVLGKVAMVPSKKDRLEAQSSKTPSFPLLPEDPSAPPQPVTPPPLPPPSLAQKHSTSKTRHAHSGGSMATLMAQFEQSHSRGLSPKNTPTKDTPIKDKGRGRMMPTKKMLMPNNTVEPPVKKQHTGSPSSEQ